MIRTFTPAYYRTIIMLACALALNACALLAPPTVPAKPTSSIGPYSKFSGRLIVIQPSKRWQVAIDWQAQEPKHGQLRLSHAATATVIDFRWSDNDMEIRDNKFPYWRPIQQDELTTYGLVIPPQQLASILLNHIPQHYIEKKPGTWESKDSGSLIRIHWQADLKKLTISDIQHGRVAKLIIQ